jgi:hypothetical protein
MQTQTILKIEQIIKKMIKDKIKSYEPETNYRPFLEALIEKNLVAQGSKIHSLSTSLGMSIYEQIAILIATKEAGYTAEKQYQLEGCIDPKTKALIDDFCDHTHKYIPNKINEIEEIRKIIKPGLAIKHNNSTVDVFIQKPNGQEVYIDIASGKMNKKEFNALRKKMLEWCALRLSQNSKINIKTCIGIPFNPYHPEPYTRWTSDNCDLKEDLLIQEDLWKEFSGGNDIFKELIEIFEKVGSDDSLRKEINNFLSK